MYNATKRRGDCDGDKRRIRERSKIDEENFIVKLFNERIGGGHGNSCLSHASRSDDADKAVVFKQ